MNEQLMLRLENKQKEIDFSGTVLVNSKDSLLAEASFGYANRSGLIRNNEATRFGIASGCKIFTAVAISQLVQEGKLTFETKLIDCLDDLSLSFNKQVTIHQLLTHTSGIPDYFDEELMDDYEELWVEKPMYHMRNLTDFLPLFQHAKMKFTPGERFHYNNAGYILLGLIVEKVSGKVFKDYIQQFLFDKAGMNDSGYFALDSLPGNVATGYIDNEDGTWKTNIYSLPVQGGSDGGAFVTPEDMIKFWDALLHDKLLSEKFTQELLKPHVQEEGDDFYGYGVWIKKNEKNIRKYHVMGYDPGVCFHSAYYPESGDRLAICSNASYGAFKMMQAVEEWME